jgi:tetratricopeptide (TPR) repeat protein
MHRLSVCGILLLVLLFSFPLHAQAPDGDGIEVAPPPRRVEPPSPAATAHELEIQGDQLRTTKNYLDALDYFRAALGKNPDSAALYNKIGITELMLQRFKEARKDFERALKKDHQHADARNNLGVTYYLQKKYGKAISEYEKAIALSPTSASYFSNLGTARFMKKEYERAALAYAQALQLDPEVFERTSRTGVSAQTQTAEDRALYDYTIAKVYARLGLLDRSLQHLRKAMEEQYKDIDNVYKDKEFAVLRKDPRFTELMKTPPPGLSD